MSRRPLSTGPACVGTGVSFFNEDEPSRAKRARLNAAALAVCAGCGVREACLAMAMRAEPDHLRWGVFGGTLPRDRRRLYRLPEWEHVHRPRGAGGHARNMPPIGRVDAVNT